MAKAFTDHSDESAEFAKSFTSFGSAVNLKVDREGETSGDLFDCCRWIRIDAGTGTITLKSKAGVSMTIPATAGETILIKASEISSVSGVTGVTVFW